MIRRSFGKVRNVRVVNRATLALVVLGVIGFGSTSAAQELNVVAATIMNNQMTKLVSSAAVTQSLFRHSVAMTDIHNQLRAQAGLPPQSLDSNLSKTAQQWAEHMASVGSMYHGGGEQIIAVSSGDRSYNAGFSLWLNSSPHRSWLCSRCNECGFGYAIGRNGAAYFAGAFGGSSNKSSQSGNFSSVSYSNSNKRSRSFRRR